MKNIFFVDARDEKSNSFHQDRQEFYNKLTSDYRIQVVENIPVNNNVDIVFVHQSFYSESNLMVSSSERNPDVKDSVLVYYGNNCQKKLEISSNEVSYFNFYVIEQNFKEFHKEFLQSKTLEGNLWQTLLGIDDELEKLLQFFENKIPLVGLGDTNSELEFKENKAMLWTYLNL